MLAPQTLHCAGVEARISTRVVDKVVNIVVGHIHMLKAKALLPYALGLVCTYPLKSIAPIRL